MGSRRHGGHSCARGDRFQPVRPVFNDDSVCGDGAQTCAQSDLDAPLDEQTMRESRQRRRHLGKNSLTALQKDQTDVAF